MTRSKVKVKVTSAWNPLKRSRPSVPDGTTFFVMTFCYTHCLRWLCCNGRFWFFLLLTFWMTDWLTGPLSNANSSFVVADAYLRNLYQVDATSGATSQLLTFGVASWPRALAYDPVAKLIYWTEDNDGIKRYSFLTHDSTVIYRDPNSTGKDMT